MASEHHYQCDARQHARHVPQEINQVVDEALWRGQFKMFIEPKFLEAEQHREEADDPPQGDVGMHACYHDKESKPPVGVPRNKVWVGAHSRYKSLEAHHNFLLRYATAFRSSRMLSLKFPNPMLQWWHNHPRNTPVSWSL